MSENGGRVEIIEFERNHYFYHNLADRKAARERGMTGQ